MERVLITGGTGLIGKKLTKKLLDKGYAVSVLSRSKKNSDSIQFHCWNIENQTIDKEALLDTDYVIHLAGSGVAVKRWTAKRKKEIIDSRVNSAKLLLNNIDTKNSKIKTFISASGVNCYGTTITSEKIFTEKDSFADDFLGKVCKQWEESATKFTGLGIRVVKLRTGIVLSKNGGAFEKLVKPIKLGFGSAIGSGKQYMPWIHIDDLCEMYIHAIENTKINDAYNAVAPEHINNQSFTKKIATSLNKSIWLPKVPSLVLKLILGDMSKIITEGSRISSDKISQTGFKFKYPTLDLALSHLVSKH
jgi:uncharacterized protein (TIGR01777 family)